MTKDELIEFLKDHLSIEVEEESDSYYNSKWAKIKLVLRPNSKEKDIVLSEDTINIK